MSDVINEGIRKQMRSYDYDENVIGIIDLKRGEEVLNALNDYKQNSQQCHEENAIEHEC